MQKKRIFNIRVTFFAFLGLMVGIILSRLFLFSSINFTITVAISLMFILIATGYVIYAILVYKKNLNNKSRENSSLLIFIASVAFVVMFIISLIISSFPLIKIMNIKEYNEEVIVHGVVSDYVDDETTYKKFILDDVKINYNDSIYNSDYKICVYTSQFSNIELGNAIEFRAELETYRYNNKNDFVKLTQNIAYSTYVNFNDISISRGSPELKDKVKYKAYNILHDNLSYDNASICYGILFGEKQGINESITETFSYSGISHILAVSGLHVGVLVGLLCFLLRLIRVRHHLFRYVKVFLLSIVVFFYAYLCSFVPSVSRASIMAILSLLCGAMGVEYDLLSGLSIAGIIILICNPLNLFSLSFQLSFLCVYSIASLAPTITKLLVKIKTPKFLASGLAISVATNIVLLPLCANIFTRVSLLGVIVNIFVLPIFSIVYVLLFIIVLLSFIINSFGVMLVVPNLFLHLIKVIANYATSISFGVFKFFNVGYFVLFALITTCLILHYLMVRIPIKSVIISIALIIVVGAFVSLNLENSYDKHDLIINYQPKSNVVFYIEDGMCTMIGSNIDMYSLNHQMKDMRIRQIDSIVAYDYELSSLHNLRKIVDEYSIDKIYISSSKENNSLEVNFDNISYYNDEISLGKLKIKDIIYKSETIALNIQLKGESYIIVPKELNKSESLYLSNENVDNENWIMLEYNDSMLWQDLNYKKIVVHKTSDKILENMIILKYENSVNLGL